MIVYLTDLDNGRYELSCAACGKPGDIVEAECVRWHLTNQIEYVCFECDWPADVPQTQNNVQPDEWLFFAIPEKNMLEGGYWNEDLHLEKIVSRPVIPSETLRSTACHIVHISTQTED